MTKPQQTKTKKGLAQMQVEVDPSDLTALPICHQSHTTECPDILMSLSNRGMATTIGDSSTILDKSHTKDCHASHASSNTNNDSMPIMLNALENFTAKISMQMLAQVPL